jgi:hypothetical protein
MDWKQLLVSITSSVDQELRLRNEYLASENRILRQQIKGRVQLSDGDRQALAVSGQKLGKQALGEIATIATPETILAWYRKFVTQKGDGSKARKVLGRPRVDQELEALVVRMAQENRSWGYDRIVGALHNLGYTMSDQTVGNILKRHGIPPAPERKKSTTWREFIRLHMDVLVATNFFTSEVWTWWGLVIFALPSFRPFSRCPLHLAGMTALLNALRRWSIPPQSSAWRVAVARWIHAVLEQGVSLLLQHGECVRRPVVSACLTHASQKHFPQSRGSVILLPVVSHCQIRDGPLRRQQRLGGLLMATNRDAA